MHAGANLRSKYDVIVVPPHATQNRTPSRSSYEHASCPKPLAYKKNDNFKSLGNVFGNDDVRGGMGLRRAAEFQKFVRRRAACCSRSVPPVFFPAEFGIAKSVVCAGAGTRLLRTGAVR